MAEASKRRRGGTGCGATEAILQRFSSSRSHNRHAESLRYFLPQARSIKWNDHSRSGRIASGVQSGAKGWQASKGSMFPAPEGIGPRSGFVGEAAYDKLVKNATRTLVAGVARHGLVVRLPKGELLGLRVRQVDLLNRSIRLNAGETKSGDGRAVKMTIERFHSFAGLHSWQG
jgi:hypothetical protein